MPCPYLMGNTSTADYGEWSQVERGISPANNTSQGPYIVSAGTTFYENRAYISVQTAYASNSCG